MEKLPCEIVRDLLPSYADRLTAPVTNRAVESHLSGCPACREALAAITGTLPALPQSDRAEIDYLQKTKKRGRRTLLLSLAALLLAVCVLLALRAYVVGAASDPRWVVGEAQVEGQNVRLRLMAVDSIHGITAPRWTEADGVLTAKTRTVIASPLSGGDRLFTYTASGPVERVVVNGRILWDDGTAISPKTSALFAAAHPYVGDASADIATAEALDLRSVLGPWTNELETETAPYGWILNLETPVNPAHQARQEQKMEAAACVLIALTGNLDRVTFRYTVGDQVVEKTVTTRQTEELAGFAVKDCADSPAALERLLLSLDF